MKQLNILLFITLIFLFGCDKILNGGVDVPECEFHSDCKDNYVCITGNCEVDLCKIENYCGEGVCVYESGGFELDTMISGIKCECEEGKNLGKLLYCPKNTACRKDPRFCETYPELCNDDEYENKRFEELVAPACYTPEPCQNTLECFQYLTSNLEVTDLPMLKTCYKNGFCGASCYGNDDNCFAKDEFCDKTNHACYPVSIFICEDGQYFSAVEQSCVAKCSQDSDCSEPVAHCNEVSGVCVSNCTTNEDCTGFKWSGGSVCNSNGFCE
ncbi:hypothetical protein JXR93_07380 [bacterium]|nr:hypothetical protein [bacterium]